MSRTGKFLQFRTIAQVCDHTDAQGYREECNWPTLDDCLIAAWDFAARSTRLPYSSNGMLIKWSIAQALVMGHNGTPHWRTIEVIALNPSGSRVIHSISDKSGIPFNLDSSDDDYGPQLPIVADYAACERFDRLLSAMIGDDSANPTHCVIRSNNLDDNDCTVIFSGNLADCQSYWSNHVSNQGASYGYSIDYLDNGAARLTANGVDEEVYIDEYLSQDFPIDNERYDLWGENSYVAPTVELVNGQLETYAEYKARCNAPMASQALGMMDQIPYYASGISNEIRNALVNRLGWPIDVAEAATIEWKELSDNSYGWVCQMPNGESFYYCTEINDFRREPTRAKLSEAHLSELLIQLTFFANLVDASFNAGDLDTAELASVFALGIARIIG